MTDKEIKMLFDAIEDFDDFNINVAQRKNMFLKDGVSIVFHDTLQPPIIEITMYGKKHAWDGLTFSSIIDEMLAEKNRMDAEEIFHRRRAAEGQLRDEIFHVKDNIYKVHDEYISHMYFLSDFASGHGAYLNKLRDLLNRVSNGKTLMVNEQRLSSKQELSTYLKSAGFYFIDQDIK